MGKLKLKEIALRWRVRIGLIAAIMALMFANPSVLSLFVGLAACLLGLFLRTWAAGHLRKDKELTVSGPYSYTRNPLYLGNLIMGIGVIIASRSLWVLLIFTFYFLFFYPLLIKDEREKMKRLFPQEYDQYGKHVPLLFPSQRTFSFSENAKFRWELYRNNKEWRALVGAGLFWLFLFGKFIFF